MAGTPRAADAAKRRETTGAGAERLQKVLAARGVASRRAAENLIREGRVTVDGRAVLEVGTKVDPERAVIKVDGRPLRQLRPLTMILNKPRGYITTASDPEGRRTIYDLLDAQALRERVYPVGRLDMDSEGLLLLTNDGELANRVAHPRYRIDKEYNALVDGTPPPAALARLRRGGFEVAGGRTSPAEVAVIGPEAGGTWVRVIIHEGRKHQIRRMMEEVGHPVRRLRRVRLGPLTLAGLPAATYRPLTAPELLRLRRMVGLTGEGEAADAPAPTRARRPPGAPLGAAHEAARREGGPREPRRDGESGRGGPEERHKGGYGRTARDPDRRGDRDRGQGGTGRPGERGDQRRPDDGRPQRPRRPGPPAHHRH